MAVPQRRYGRCPCTGIYQERRVEVRMKGAGDQVVLTDVAQGACPQCGSRVYKIAILETLERLYYASVSPSS